MAKFALFFCLALAVISLGGGQATDEKDEKRATRQIDDELYYDPYNLESLLDLPLSYNYQAGPRIGGFGSEERSFYRNPLKYPYFYKGGYEESQPQARLNGLGVAAFSNLLFSNRFNNNRPRPLASLSNFIPLQWNPNFPNVASTYDSCTAPSGEAGICAPGSLCSVFGGRPSGSCGLGGVCCINAVTTCGSTITLHNTYWQAPTTIVSPSSCAVNIRLDTKLLEQKKPICQVRLDFVAFTTAQPTDGVCTTDTFQVIGGSTAAPLICGDNAGQHMYVNVPNSAKTPTSLQLFFNLGAGATVTRSWNIKISLLPCGADYLAPPNCLQYFTSATGRVTSFNFNSAPANRQLANQDYNICFRTEQLNGQSANTICMDVCTVPAGTVPPGIPFRISGDDTGKAQKVEEGFCSKDFLVFVGARTNSDVSLDRLCGGAFTAVSEATASATLCSTALPFRLYFKTDGDEPVPDTGAIPPVIGDTNNVGFCLNFRQSFV